MIWGDDCVRRLGSWIRLPILVGRAEMISLMRYCWRLRMFWLRFRIRSRSLYGWLLRRYGNRSASSVMCWSLSKRISRWWIRSSRIINVWSVPLLNMNPAGRKANDTSWNRKNNVRSSLSPLSSKQPKKSIPHSKINWSTATQVYSGWSPAWSYWTVYKAKTKG